MAFAIVKTIVQFFLADFIQYLKLVISYLR